ncbi:MAG: hypothetical protein AAF497_16915, partial [Planctomycetota bacterium]
MQGDDTHNPNHQPLVPMAQSYSRWARCKMLFVLGMCLGGAITVGGPLFMMFRFMGLLDGAEVPPPTALASTISSGLFFAGIGMVCFAVALFGYL